MSDPSETSSASPDPGYLAYAQFVHELVVDQEKRKESLEARAVSVIATSGSLVSLLFGLAALTTGVDNFKLPGGATAALATAVFLFVAASALALVVRFPRNYDAVDGAGLKRMFGTSWDASSSWAHLRVTKTKRAIFEDAQRVNDSKAFTLFMAMLMQVLAVLALAVAVTIVLQA